MEFPLKKEGIIQSNKNCDSLDSNELEDLNLKAIDLISEDKADEALSYLKKGEVMLENMVLDTKVKIDKKLLFIILHNMACCYQKLKDFDNCVIYLEAVIFHFDNLVESKFNLRMNEEYFINVINDNLKSETKLGDIILQIRFSAKFHLQMCAVLSQNNNHSEALNHAKLASIMCEDNIIKSQILFNQIANENNVKKGKSSKNLTKTNHLTDTEDFVLFDEKIKDTETIFSILVGKIRNYRNIEEENSKQHEKPFELLKKNVRKVLSVKSKDDWTTLLNIGNIMYLSALNIEDLDLDSDSKFELLRDAIIEKIIMLTVAYFCVATEIRFLVDLNLITKNDSEYWHFKSIDISRLFLPGSCPIVKHYISSYNKHYSTNLEPILEDELFDQRIQIIKFDVYDEDDQTILFRSIKQSAPIGKDECKEKAEYLNNIKGETSIKKNNEDKIKIKEIETKMTQNKIEKLSKTRNIVSPTKSQTTHYTIIKKSLTPFIFISSNKEDLTLNKSKLDKENLTRKLYLSNNTNNSNSKLKIKSINSLKYINTTNFLKIKDSKLPMLKIALKDSNIERTTCLSPPKQQQVNKKIKVKSITSMRDNIYQNTNESDLKTNVNVMSPKGIESRIINQIFKKENLIKRQLKPSSLTRISIKK